MRLVQWILLFALPSGVLFARACQCGKGWDHVLKHCYQFYTTTNEMWTSTERKCEGMQATLPVLKTQQDLFQFSVLVTKYANTTNDKMIPVGLRFDRDVWVWADGRQLDNTTWVTDNPAGSQVYAYYTKVKGRTKLKEGTDEVGMNWEMKICQRMCPESNIGVSTTPKEDDSAGTTAVIVLLVICALAIITLVALVGLYYKKGSGDVEPTPIPDMLSQTGKPELDNIKTADLFTAASGTASSLPTPPATSPKKSAGSSKKKCRASPKGSRRDDSPGGSKKNGTPGSRKSGSTSSKQQH